jgi:hypothetical protein
MSASVVTPVMREIMVVHHNALPLRFQTCECRLRTVQPMLTGLETTRVSMSMYHEAADRVWEQATLSKHVCKCTDTGDARNYGCTP